MKTMGRWKQDASDSSHWTRKAGLNENGFYSYAHSRVTGPSDTFWRVSLKVRDPAAVSRSKLLHAWTILRSRHPLLDCELRKSPDLRFHYTSTDNARRAQETFWLGPVTRPWESERDHLSNGPRIINEHKLSCLKVFYALDLQRIEVVLICSHAISDASSMSIFMNDYLRLLTDDKPLLDRNLALNDIISRLPSAMEAQLPRWNRTSKDLWQAAIAYTIYGIRERKSKIEAESFAWDDIDPVTRQQVFEFSSEVTRLLVTASRRQRCTIGHLIYAASTAAFTDVATVARPGAHVIIGTPTDARRFFREPLRSRRDEMIVALSFIDFELPCIRIRDATGLNIKRLWTLARLAKTRVHGRIADPLFPYYSYISQEKRVALGMANQTTSFNPTGQRRTTRLSFGSSSVGTMEHILSLQKDRALEILDVNFGMRARAGESLMHSYSFQGRLRLSLVYDDQLGSAKMQTWLQRTGELMEAVSQVQGARI